MHPAIKATAKVVHVAVIPVTLVVDYAHKGAVHTSELAHSKKVHKVVIGVVIMLVGSTMATTPVAFIPHVVWDAIAYGLHGYGALPIIKILCKKLDLEHLE